MYKILARPLLFRFTSDYAHEMAIKTATLFSKNQLALKTTGALYSYSNKALRQKIWGHDFKNPVGLAAGFDKNGTMAPIMEELGFGFLEIGSITAQPSTGNPKPRSFRLPKDRSIINRMGLNNDGAKTISRRIRKLSLNVPLGINIAKTHNPAITGKEALLDYKFSFDQAKDFADYITINISCPNTKEGKTFEEPEPLNKLLEFLEVNKDSGLPPILVKFSADLDSKKLSDLLTVCEGHAISGYVATNTSSGRENLTSQQKTVTRMGHGGLSGSAIARRSTEIIEQISDETHREKTIIGVGGISSGQDAIDKIKAGADLLQVYTGLVFEGPGLVKKINKQLVQYMNQNGLEHIYQIRSY